MASSDEVASPASEPEGNGLLALVEEGSEYDRGFVLGNVYHSPADGDIHYSVSFPEGYDAEDGHEYALFVTLPGWEGLYFQGTGANLVEPYGFVASDYVEDAIVVAPQLEDWGQTSADQAIALTELFLESYPIDESRVFIEGFSAGGETLSLVLDKRPELFTRALFVSSQWDGGYENVAAARIPLYIVIGRNDSYYGSDPATEAYDGIREIYVAEGLSAGEIDELLVLDVREHAYFQEKGVSDEHMGASLFAYDDEVMGWLFGSERG